MLIMLLLLLFVICCCCCCPLQMMLLLLLFLLLMLLQYIVPRTVHEQCNFLDDNGRSLVLHSPLCQAVVALCSVSCLLHACMLCMLCSLQATRGCDDDIKHCHVAATASIGVCAVCDMACQHQRNLCMCYDIV